MIKSTTIFFDDFSGMFLVRLNKTNTASLILAVFAPIEGLGKIFLCQLRIAHKRA
jgi:hypothetical protein